MEINNGSRAALSAAIMPVMQTLAENLPEEQAKDMYEKFSPMLTELETEYQLMLKIVGTLKRRFPHFVEAEHAD